MDVSETILANSEQVGAEDLLGGPVTTTITGVEKGTAEQPVFIHLEAFEGRTFRPAKSVRRVLVACWGPDSSVYLGRRITIYNEPSVRWAGKEVGGVRVSHVSNIDRPVTVALTVSRGKREPFVVQPLGDDTDTFGARLETAATMVELQAVWDAVRSAGRSTDSRLVRVKDQRKAELAGVSE